MEEDREYGKKKAMGKIRAYVERQPETIEKKAEIIVEHFLKKVYMKIGGKARAMVITSSIERAIEFYKVITIARALPPIFIYTFFKKCSTMISAFFSIVSG